MADFEGSMNLAVETSEIEIEGKYKLAEEELAKVAGGAVVGGAAVDDELVQVAERQAEAARSGERKEYRTEPAEIIDQIFNSDLETASIELQLARAHWGGGIIHSSHAASDARNCNFERTNLRPLFISPSLVH